MLFDANAGGREAFARTFDVCVVGSGPAGITLARRLAAQGLDVALMEGGDCDCSSESQDLYVGENVGLDYFEPDTTRLRYLGGSSNHWGGRCRLLDASDFLPRPDHPLSGWPITKAELDPYQPQTAEILDLARRRRLSRSAARAGLQPVPQDPVGLQRTKRPVWRELPREIPR